MAHKHRSKRGTPGGRIIQRGRMVDGRPVNPDHIGRQPNRITLTNEIVIVRIHICKWARDNFEGFCRKNRIECKELESAEKPLKYNKNTGAICLDKKTGRPLHDEKMQSRCHLWQVMGDRDALNELCELDCIAESHAALSAKIPRGIGQGAGPLNESAERRKRIARSLYVTTAGHIADPAHMKQHIRDNGIIDARDIQAIGLTDAELIARTTVKNESA